MFVIDNKENVSLINSKIVCDYTRSPFLCDLLQTFLLLYCSDVLSKHSVVNGRLLGSPVDRAVVMEQGVAGLNPARFNF